MQYKGLSSNDLDLDICYQGHEPNLEQILASLVKKLLTKKVHEKWFQSKKFVFVKQKIFYYV